MVKRRVLRFATGVLCAAAVVVLHACRNKPTAGVPCKIADQVVCDGNTRALTCNFGAWVEVPCRGRQGCSHRGDADQCDDTVAAEGDPCPRNPPLDYACTVDRTKALACNDGKFSLWRACRGPDRCDVVDGRNLHCDTTLAEAGDPCGQQGTYSCSVDGKNILLCDGNSLAVASSCRGKEGCRIEHDTHKIDCDDSVAIEGDPCDQPKRISCSLDHKAELVCASSKYAKKRDCRRSDCKLDGNELFCD